jgi:hypothetical protein
LKLLILIRLARFPRAKKETAMKNILFLCCAVIFSLIASSIFMSHTPAEAQTLYSMYGSVWLTRVDSCAPIEWYLYIMVIYEDGPDTAGPYFMVNNCLYRYNTPYGEGNYKIIGWHVYGAEAVTYGSTSFYYTGPSERHDFKVYPIMQPEP